MGYGKMSIFPNEWWPQGSEIEPINGRWQTTAYIGGAAEDVGERYNIVIHNRR